MNPRSSNKIHRLERAFRDFSQTARQLSESYEALKRRAARLARALNRARGERFRRLVEKERLANRLSLLFAALPAGVVMLDRRGRIREYNPAAEALLGGPLRGHAWREIVERAFSPQGEGDSHACLRDGRRVSVELRSLDGEPGQIVLLHDVTESCALQEHLERSRRLTVLGEMAARLAHQVRTPLAACVLYVAQLERLLLDTKEAHRGLARLRAGLRQLDRLVNDMLIIARGGSGPVERIAVSALLDELEQLVQPLIDEAGCRLERIDESAGAVCYARRAALLGALQNLLVNAAQACGRGGRLRLYAGRDATGAVELRVSDDGPGIPVEMQRRIFEPFFTTRPGGTGLGLAVVQAVARAHQAELWVESKPGLGATFGLRLPAPPPALSRRRPSARRLEADGCISAAGATR